MKITPLDIQQQQFRVHRLWGGFDIEEVDNFLDLVAHEVEELIKENNLLREEDQRRLARIQELEGEREKIRETLLSVQQITEEMKKNGYLYLIALRVVPVLPFFLVNYLAGFTKVRLRTFAWTTLAGMLPGSIVYTFAGQQLRSVNSTADLLSKEIIAALVPLVIFSLVPVLVRYMRRRRRP